MTSLSPFRKRAREMRSDVWDTFSDFFNDNFFAPVRGNSYIFRTDIKDFEDYYLIEAELPGFEKEEIEVDYENNYLTISAQRENITKDEKDHIIRQERLFGKFVRPFYVSDIDENRIDASFKNGILTLKCPKKPLENANHKRIEIH